MCKKQIQFTGNTKQWFPWLNKPWEHCNIKRHFQTLSLQTIKDYTFIQMYILLTLNVYIFSRGTPQFGYPLNHPTHLLRRQHGSLLAVLTFLVSYFCQVYSEYGTDHSSLEGVGTDEWYTIECNNLGLDLMFPGVANNE